VLALSGIFFAYLLGEARDRGNAKHLRGALGLSLSGDSRDRHEAKRNGGALIGFQRFSSGTLFTF